MHCNAEAVHLPEGQPSSSFQLGNSKKRAAIFSSATPETSRMIKRRTAAATKPFFSLWSPLRWQAIVSLIRCERRNRIRFPADRLPNDDLPLSSAMIAAIFFELRSRFCFSFHLTMHNDIRFTFSSQSYFCFSSKESQVQAAATGVASARSPFIL
jgi:hypothetical protein